MRSVSLLVRGISLLLAMIVHCSCKKNNPGSVYPTPPSPPVQPPPVPPPPLPPDQIVETEPSILTPVNMRINAAFGGYYLATPKHYEQTTKKYPLIFFLHGLGQMGNGAEDLKYLLNDGIGKTLAKGKFPPSVKVGDSSYSFLVVSPQYSRAPYVLEVAAVIGHVLATYRVDSSRIYLAGLSMGARIASLVGARYPSGFAAMVPIAGISDNDELMSRCDSMAHANLPVWALHNLDDPLSDVNIVRTFIDSLTIRSPDPLPRLTVFDAYGHDAWTAALDPAFRENGLNIYEWMLQYSR